MPTYERPVTKNDLKAVRQYKGETLRQYIQRFSQMRNKIPRISNEEVISVFSTGVSDIKMREKLSVNDELTSIVRLFEIADRCAKAEEGRLFVHNLPEALPPKPKSKDPKICTRQTIAAATLITVVVAAIAPGSTLAMAAATPTSLGDTIFFMKLLDNRTIVGIVGVLFMDDAVAATSTFIALRAVPAALLMLGFRYEDGSLRALGVLGLRLWGKCLR
jgi:hypothetical protein